MADFEENESDRAARAVEGRGMSRRFETKDSGERQQFDSGMQRDTEAGKARFDLLIPEGVPYEEQLLTRFAELMSRGAEKYDARNWEQANSEAEIARARSSAFRHFMQWFCGETDEDHAVAFMFNVMVIETTRWKLDQQERDETEVDWREPELPTMLSREEAWANLPVDIRNLQDRVNEDIARLARVTTTRWDRG